VQLYHGDCIVLHVSPDGREMYTCMVEAAPTSIEEEPTRSVTEDAAAGHSDQEVEQKRPKPLTHRRKRMMDSEDYDNYDYR
jgi:hypothetical protein